MSKKRLSFGDFVERLKRPSLDAQTPFDDFVKKNPEFKSFDREHPNLLPEPLQIRKKKTSSAIEKLRRKLFESLSKESKTKEQEPLIDKRIARLILETRILYSNLGCQNNSRGRSRGPGRPTISVGDSKPSAVSAIRDGKRPIYSETRAQTFNLVTGHDVPTAEMVSQLPASKAEKVSYRAAACKAEGDRGTAKIEPLVRLEKMLEKVKDRKASLSVLGVLEVPLGRPGEMQDVTATRHIKVRAMRDGTPLLEIASDESDNALSELWSRRLSAAMSEYTPADEGKMVFTTPEVVRHRAHRSTYDQYLARGLTDSRDGMYYSARATPELLNTWANKDRGFSEESISPMSCSRAQELASRAAAHELDASCPSISNGSESSASVQEQ